MPETIGHLSGTNSEISEFAVEGGWEARELRQPICVRTKFCPADFVRSLALRDGLGAGSPELVFIDSQSLYLRIERLGWDAELRCRARWAGDASVTCRERGFDHLFFPLMQNATKRKHRASCCAGGRPLEPSLVDGKNVTVAQNNSPLNYIVQLTNVAGPTIRVKEFERSIID